MPSAPPIHHDPSPDHPAADESLMLRYVAGEIAAFDLLYARHEIAVWRYLLRSVRTQAVADDLLQDVWFAVARQAAAGAGCGDTPAYQPTARFKTWLFTIAHNRLVDHFRKTGRHGIHVSLDGGSDADDDAASPAERLAADSGFGPMRQLIASEQAAALLVAVQALPPDQRQAFLLQAEAGLSVEDIATATSVTFETAKSRLRYARNSLRRQLQEFA